MRVILCRIETAVLGITLKIAGAASSDENNSDNLSNVIPATTETMICRGKSSTSRMSYATLSSIQGLTAKMMTSASLTASLLSVVVWIEGLNDLSSFSFSSPR